MRPTASFTIDKTRYNRLQSIFTKTTIWSIGVGPRFMSVRQVKTQQLSMQNSLKIKVTEKHMFGLFIKHEFMSSPCVIKIFFFYLNSTHMFSLTNGKDIQLQFLHNILRNGFVEEASTGV